MEFKSLEQLFEENNGRTVVMDRRMRVRPRRYRGGEDIWLEPVNKNAPWYRKMRDYLGDDWVTDAKHLEGKNFAEVYRQLAWKQPSTPGRKATTSRKKAPARRR
jgi:hypothetical protein